MEQENQKFEAANLCSTTVSGEDAFISYLKEKSQKLALTNNFNCTEAKGLVVIVHFVVDEFGSMSSFVVQRGINSTIDEAAIRATKEMDLTWKPAMKDKRIVKCSLHAVYNLCTDK